MISQVNIRVKTEGKDNLAFLFGESQSYHGPTKFSKLSPMILWYKQSSNWKLSCHAQANTMDVAGTQWLIFTFSEPLVSLIVLN